MVRTAVAVRGWAMEHGAEMSKGSNNVEFEKSLILKGWVRGPDGSLTAPTRHHSASLGGLGSGIRKQPEGLESKASSERGSKGSLGGGSHRSVPKRNIRSADGCDPIVIVRFICIRPKFLDDDNLVGGCKPLRDAVAEWIGVNDGDHRVEWIYRQQVGPKPHGTIVMITTKKG